MNNKEIEFLIQKNTLREVEIKLKEAQIKGMIIPEVVFEIIHNVEDSYKPKTEEQLEAEFDKKYANGDFDDQMWLNDELPDRKDAWISEQL